MTYVISFFAGIVVFTIVRVLIGCLYTVRPDQRAVVTTFGAAEKLPNAPAESGETEKEDRYTYPQLRVIGPGGPYFKLPWQEVHKVRLSLPPTAQQGGDVDASCGQAQHQTMLHMQTI